MAGSSVQTQANAQRLRNYGLGAAFIVVFYLLHLGGVCLLPSFIHLVVR